MLRLPRRCLLVDEALWTAAQARIQAAFEVYRHRTSARAFGQPANGVESPSLLTAVGTCAVCRGSMAVMKRAHGPPGTERVDHRRPARSRTPAPPAPPAAVPA